MLLMLLVWLLLLLFSVGGGADCLVGRPFETTKDEGLMTERRKEIHTMMVDASKAKGSTLEKRIIAKSLKESLFMLLIIACSNSFLST